MKKHTEAPWRMRSLLSYGVEHEHSYSLDLVLFLNGLPVATAELKNPLSGQTVE